MRDQGTVSVRAPIAARVNELDLAIDEARAMADGLRDKILGGAQPVSASTPAAEQPPLAMIGYDRAVDRMLERIKSVNETLRTLHAEL
jgi:hypothetical protein